MEGQLKEIWRTQTQAGDIRDGYLSDDGRYFVRIGTRFADMEKHSDLAIAFYDRGTLLQQYTVQQLIQEPGRCGDFVTHYTWRPAQQTQPTGFDGQAFHLVLIDKTAYRFDITTGAILTRSRDEGAQSPMTELDKMFVPASRKGLELFQASSFHADFQRHFHLADVYATTDALAATEPSAPRRWRATFLPRRPLAYAFCVKLTLPMVEGSALHTEVTSEQILQTMKLAFQHPYFLKHHQPGPLKTILLCMDGDLPHWSTSTLLKYLPKDATLAHWAEIRMPVWDFTVPFFLNTQTREVLVRTPDILDDEYRRLDAEGNPVESQR